MTGLKPQYLDSFPRTRSGPGPESGPGQNRFSSILPAVLGGLVVLYLCVGAFKLDSIDGWLAGLLAALDKPPSSGRPCSSTI